MIVYDLIIIGGGASGIMAAITASQYLDKILIIEKNNRIGKKILVTGNGRCNYTNAFLKTTDFNNPAFVENIFNQFDPQDTIDFFETLGIEPKIEDEGKAYPLSEQSSSFLDVFLFEIKKRNIQVELNKEVIDIFKKNDVFKVVSSANEAFLGKKVIIATGGKSMPSTGSNGSGLDLAKNLGHKITEVFPALVKLRVDSPYLKQLAGVKINTQVDLLVGNEVVQSEYGDLLFANYGISGPTILELSRKANEKLMKRLEVFVKIVLIQSLPKSKIIERFEMFKSREIDQSLIGLVNKRFINVLIKEAGIEKNNMVVGDIPKQNIFKLIDLLYDWRLKVTGSLGFDDSQVTAGGIELTEIHESTLESKLIQGLYFTGEVLDVDGRCGGYNLQWAWSSGYVAAKSACEEIRKND
ncbi:MAG: aminoacetone oxidase family FAD-binding enzyme [Tenericutes bacterium HGW-Tenericutes-5]|nr:MAG: aminoacetone oxidase family FAD-binding enzyme [Tenericutes bacterium HGW-Tenericutes-5]